MPTLLPSGKWRARVRHPRTRKHVSARSVIGGPDTFETSEDAARAEKEANRVLRSSARAGTTVREFWKEWTTSPLWLRPAESTNIHNRERTTKFVDAYGDVPMRAVDDDHVSAWLREGHVSTVPALRAFFNDASSPGAGRIVDRNPFANLRLPASRGRKDTQPPDQVEIARLLSVADELTPPTFAAYVLTAVYEGMRPGELDALTWEQIDFQSGTIHVDRQWNVKEKRFTLPKHGHMRTVALTDPARERLLSLPRESEFAFTTLRGTHYRPSTRVHHWNRVRCAAGLGNVDLYTATRHYFGWYTLNVLGVRDLDIAAQFGHRDGGKLVRTLYGHPDAKLARDRMREAFREDHRPLVALPARRAV